MKTKLAIAFTGLVACSLAFAQTNDNTAGASATAATSTSAEATTNATVEVTTNAGTEPSPSATTTATSSAVIPLIVMDDVPLTDAIKNLARQAALNYMLDPKISYGQPDATGKIPLQPTVSIRWENVTAEQALAALLNNYNFQLVLDPRTKIARVTLKDPAAPPALYTRILQLKYASPSNVLAAVQSSFADPKRSKVVADTRTSQLVVVATEKELDAIDEMVVRLDAQTRQVLIEARLLETSINPSTAKGLNWQGTLQAQNLAFGNNLQTAPVVANDSKNAPLATLWPKLMFDSAHGFNPATAFLDADGVNAVFSFFNQDSEAKVLSAPRTVTLDNEMSHIAVTRASPIINVTPGTANTTGGSQITYTNLGVILDVTPRISANNFVNLKVEPEVSRIFARTKTQVGSAGVIEADVYDVRKMMTHVMIPSGNTLVLGGLVQDDQRTDDTKVPLMGDLPIIGHAFRSNSKSRQKSNLLVFITPTIIQDSDYQPTTTDFLKAPLPKSDDTEWSTWDSTKPLDWSKPVVDQSNPPKHRDPINPTY